MDWAKANQNRDQLVLFPTRLNEAVGPDHRVRLLDDILSRLDWSNWEADYDLTRGQPPIHPRILTGVILYGLLTRIRSSRNLEEALQVRLDFRWLVEGRSIDHRRLASSVANTTREKRRSGGGRRVRHRYQASCRRLCGVSAANGVSARRSQASDDQPRATRAALRRARGKDVDG